MTESGTQSWIPLNYYMNSPLNYSIHKNIITLLHVKSANSKLKFPKLFQMFSKFKLSLPYLYLKWKGINYKQISLVLVQWFLR